MTPPNGHAPSTERQRADFAERMAEWAAAFETPPFASAQERAWAIRGQDQDRASADIAWLATSLRFLSQNAAALGQAEKATEIANLVDLEQRMRVRDLAVPAVHQGVYGLAGYALLALDALSLTDPRRRATFLYSALVFAYGAGTVAGHDQQAAVEASAADGDEHG